jgi:hypothetical protein
LAEEFSYVSAEFVHDYISAKQLPLPTKRLHPTVLSLEIGDWADLAAPQTIARVAQFLTLIDESYNTIVSALGEEHRDGLEAKQIFTDLSETIAAASGLSEETRGARVLGHFLLQILPWCNGRLGKRLESGASLHNLPEHFLTAVTPLQGLAYAGCFSKTEGTLYLNVRMCKFSDLGGAGCAIINGMPVRIKKGKTPMTSEQLTARKDFVRSVLDVAIRE